jgi:hypothetical protein
MAAATFTELPKDLKREIFRFADLHEFQARSLIDAEHAEIAEDSKLWEEAIQQIFTTSGLDIALQKEFAQGDMSKQNVLAYCRKGGVFLCDNCKQVLLYWVVKGCCSVMRSRLLAHGP